MSKRRFTMFVFWMQVTACGASGNDQAYGQQTSATPPITPFTATTQAIPTDGNQLAPSGIGTAASTHASPFIKIVQDSNGSHLVRNGAPFRMVGYQASLSNVTNYCGWNQNDLVSGFAEMQTHSNVNTVRMWFLQSAGGPGDWTAFDAAVAAAKAHGFVIIATLVNQWGDCEPEVGGAKNYKTITWYQGGYKQTNDGYPLSFRDFAQAVVARYANEPTIAFWQLINESEARDPVTNTCPSESASAAAIRAFADDMANLLHSTDANHLVNLGTQDNGYCGVDGSDFQYVHAGSIDLCEVHSYEPANEAFPSAVSDKVAMCNAINKPIFMGETGICPNVQSDGTCSGSTTAATLQARANFFDAKFAANFAGGLQGVLIWQWSPGSVDTSYGVFTGDPIEAMMQKY